MSMKEEIMEEEIIDEIFGTIADAVNGAKKDKEVKA